MNGHIPNHHLKITQMQGDHTGSLFSRFSSLKNMKIRLVERKEIIEQRFYDRQHDLEQRHTAFQRQKDQLDPADIEQYEANDKELRFRINMCKINKQLRLDKHNECAFGKLNDLYRKFKTDPRLSVLYSNA